MIKKIDYNSFFPINKNFKPYVIIKDEIIPINNIKKIEFSFDVEEISYPSVHIHVDFKTSNLDKIISFFSSPEDFSGTLRFLDCSILIEENGYLWPARIQGCSTSRYMYGGGSTIIRINLNDIDDFEGKIIPKDLMEDVRTNRFGLMDI